MRKNLQSCCPAILDHLIENQPAHPLHVVITVKGLEECSKLNVGLENDGYFIGALLPNASSYSSNIFVYVHVLDIEKEVPDVYDDDRENLLHIYVSIEFLKHYNLTFMQKVFIRPVECVPLTKVVFAARTEAGHMWAQHINSHDNALATCEMKFLCRLHDVLLPPSNLTKLRNSSVYDLFVVACEPVNQGLLTAETTVIFLNVGSKLVCDILQSGNDCCMTANSSILSKLYITHSCFDKLPIATKVTNPDVKFTRKPDGFISFRIEIIPKFDSVFNPELVESNTLDPLNTVFLKPAILKKMNIVSGSYAKVKLSSVQDKKKQELQSSGDFDESEKYRIVTVCAIDETKESCDIADELVAYVTPQLWFNLNAHPSKLLQPHCSLLMSFKAAKSFSPSVAKEVYISLVQSPCYDGSINCDKMIKKYFSQPRYLCKGDIFGISTRDDVEFYQRSYEADSVIAKPIIYFRVSVIEDSSDYGSLVYRDYAKMFQAGTAQFYIPVMLSSFYFDSNPSFMESPTPPGLNYYVDILEEMIEPILSIQNNCHYGMNSSILVTGEAGCGKSVVVRTVCKRLNLHLYEVNCHELLGETSGTIEARLKIIMEKALMYAPCIMMLKNINFIAKRKESSSEDSRVLSTFCDLLGKLNSPDNEWPAVVVATSDNSKLIDGDMSTAFLHVVNIEPLQEWERFEILENLLKPFPRNFDLPLVYLAQRTAGFILSDLCTFISETANNCHKRLQQLLKSNWNYLRFEEDVNLAGFPVINEDFTSALDVLQSEYSKASGAPKIPNVLWQDVGGLAHVKKEILDTVQFPLDHPEIFSAGLRRSGVLLYGPPGTGKTLLAKAVATECSLNFISIKGPELINRYVGESEANVRTIFQQARSAVPCILFFDELDSLAPNRGRSGDSGGVMDRVVSQLLSEIDGLNNSSTVFVIGATNRPDLIDPALLRPGRFDRLVYVGIPESKESKLSILKALTRNLNLADDVSLSEIIDCCPGNFTGADFYALCSEAMMNRIQKNIELVESGKVELEKAITEIQTEDFLSAAKNLTSSVSEKDVAYYKSLSISM